ncbi:MAG: phosphohistidine phosphatase SixA [Phycisphaerae bacterium]|nr:phosphohistidine phosphatase SixA [Phycisphaerae bacterium]
MQLYFIRHAIAVDASPRVTTPDGERALTEDGAKKMRRQARALEQMGVTFDLALTSPLLRAVQTAEIVCEVLGCADRMERCEVLAPGCELDEIVEVLRGHQSLESVALVGHNPDFEEIAPAIIGCTAEGGMVFRKGGMCRIDVLQFTPHLCGELIWHLTPKLLRMIEK